MPTRPTTHKGIKSQNNKLSKWVEKCYPDLTSYKVILLDSWIMPSVFAIHVTEQITTSYEFDTEEEAKTALESMDFMLHESEVICGEVLNTEIVELN